MNYKTKRKIKNWINERSKNYWLKKDFNDEQKIEILVGIDQAINVRKFADKQLSAEVMETIRKAMLSGIELWRYLEWTKDVEVLKLIKQAILSNLDAEVIAKAALDAERTKIVMDCMKLQINYNPIVDEKMTITQAQNYMKEQIEKKVFNKKLKEKFPLTGDFIDIGGYDERQLEQIQLALEEGTDTSTWALPRYNWAQMLELRLAKKQGIRLDYYVNEKQSSGYFRKTRQELEEKKHAGKD